MSSSSLLRLGALAAVVGGVLFLSADLFGLILAELQPAPIAAFTLASYAVVSEVLGVIAGILLTGGLVGLYVGRSEVMGVIGLAGFILAFVGEVLVNGWSWVWLFLTAALAQQAPELLDADTPALVNLGTTLSLVLLGLGWLVFGAAALRKGAYPRVAAILVIVSSVLQIIPPVLLSPGPLGGGVFTLGRVAFDVAVIWMGLTLFRKDDEALHQTVARAGYFLYGGLLAIAGLSAEADNESDDEGTEPDTASSA